MSYELRDITFAIARWHASEPDKALRDRMDAWLRELVAEPWKKPWVAVPSLAPAVAFFVTNTERPDIELVIPCIVEAEAKVIHIVGDVDVLPT